MGWKDLVWYGILGSVTAAYAMAMVGVRAARLHDVLHHSRWMMRASTIVGIWLVAYVTKQVLVGRDEFGGTSEQYWQLYIPLLAVHTSLAVITIGLGVYNLYTGIIRIRGRNRDGEMGAFVTGHRVTGWIFVWTFSGTIMTAYGVYLMLFRWFPAS